MPAAPRFTFMQLRYFVAVAEAGSVAAAAERLHIAQSAVAAAIAHLEECLSVQLFIRHRAKGVQITHAGRRLLTSARGLLEHGLEVEEDTRGLVGASAGELRVACFAFIAPFFLPGVLEGFREAHPQIRIVVEEDTIEGVQASLLRAESDVGLLYDVNLSPRLSKQVIATYPPYVLLPADHRFSDRESVHLADLADEPFIQVDLPLSRDYSAVIAREAGVALNTVFRTKSFEMVRELVAHGFGYSILNQRWSSKHANSGKPVHVCEIRDRLPPIDLVVAHVEGIRTPKRAEIFSQFCREHFSSTGMQTG